MMTQTNEPATTTGNTDSKTTLPKSAAVPKSATVTLTAHGATMSIVAERQSGGAKTYVLTSDENGKNTKRGMTTTHESFEAAKAATEKVAKAAEKLGWQRKQKRQGFVARPDAFSSLPAAPKAKK